MNFFSRILKLIDSSDLILEVMDARFPFETRNLDLEKKIVEKEKELILVLNKADLVKKKVVEKNKTLLEKDFPTVFLSTKQGKGLNRLRELIGKKCKKKCLVGVIGYPNTGKSSLINALKRKKKARTSIKAGFTRGEQLIKLSKKITLIDSPGIIPFKEKDETKLALLGAKSAEKLNNPLNVGEKIIELFLKENFEKLKEFYGILGREESVEEILKEIALKKGRLLKGGKEDLVGASKIILLDWQKGKLKFK